HISPQFFCFFFFQAEDGIRDFHVTGVQTCALPIWATGIGSPSETVGSSRTATLRSTQPARRRGTTSSGPSNPTRQIWATGRSARSEERRVGKEGGCGWAPEHERKT